MTKYHMFLDVIAATILGGLDSKKNHQVVEGKYGLYQLDPNRELKFNSSKEYINWNNFYHPNKNKNIMKVSKRRQGFCRFYLNDKLKNDKLLDDDQNIS